MASTPATSDHPAIAPTERLPRTQPMRVQRALLGSRSDPTVINKPSLGLFFGNGLRASGRNTLGISPACFFSRHGAHGGSSCYSELRFAFLIHPATRTRAGGPRVTPGKLYSKYSLCRAALVLLPALYGADAGKTRTAGRRGQNTNRSAELNHDHPLRVSS